MRRRKETRGGPREGAGRQTLFPDKRDGGWHRKTYALSETALEKIGKAAALLQSSESDGLEALIRAAPLEKIYLVVDGSKSDPKPRPTPR